MEQTLAKQNITSQSKLLLKIKFFKNPVHLVDSLAIHLFYLQIQQKIISGEYLCSERMAVRLGSYHLQIVMGDYDMAKYKDAFEE
jgi:hypothetical protein